MDKKVCCGGTPCFSGIEQIRTNWGWFLGLGILLIILGIAAISSAFYVTLFSVFLLGILLIAGGAVHIVHAFMAKEWSGLFLTLLLGILYVATGVICVAKPAIAAISLTLWIAAFFFIAGLFRMITSAMARFEHWGWVFFNGLVTFILGILIFSDWPVSGLWVIGLFIGIDLILSGWSCVLLSIAARQALK